MCSSPSLGTQGHAGPYRYSRDRGSPSASRRRPPHRRWTETSVYCRGGVGDDEADVGHRLRHRLADQIEPAELLDAGFRLGDLVRAENKAEQAASVDQADQHHIARIGDLIGQHQLAQPRPDLTLFAVIDDGIPARAKYPQKPAVLLTQHAFCDETLQRNFLIFLAIDAEPLEHRIGGELPAGFGKPLQHIVEDVVAGRRRVDQDQPFEVGIDAVGERQLHQRRAGEYDIGGRQWQIDEFALAVVELQQKDFFYKTQHPPTPQRAAAMAAAASGWMAKILSNPLTENTTRTLGTSPNSTILPLASCTFLATTKRTRRPALLMYSSRDISMARRGVPSPSICVKFSSEACAVLLSRRPASFTIATSPAGSWANSIASLAPFATPSAWWVARCGLPRQ